MYEIGREQYGAYQPDGTEQTDDFYVNVYFPNGTRETIADGLTGTEALEYVQNTLEGHLP